MINSSPEKDCVSNDIVSEDCTILIEKLTLNLNEAVVIFNDFFNLRKDSIFSGLSQCIRDEIIKKADQSTRLSGVDEKIYEYYKNLMDCYREIETTFENSKKNIYTKNIKNILEGIVSVLSSSLKHFDENSSEDENPVLAEKNKIILRHINFFKKNFNYMENNFKIEEKNESNQYGFELLSENFDYPVGLKVMDYAVFKIKSYCSLPFYKFYKDTTRALSVNLNDMQSTGVVFYYRDLLEKEQEILSSIIKIQVDALENETRNARGTIEEKRIVHKILSYLREGYQYVLKDVAEIKEIENTNNPLEFENQLVFEEKMNAAIKDNMLSEEIFNRFSESFREKIDSIYTVCKDKLEEDYEQGRVYTGMKNAFINKSLYEMQKLISIHLILADELSSAFGKIIKYHKDNSETLNLCDQKEIINGILETMEIKVESITENKYTFFESCKSLVENYKADIEITEEDKTDSFEKLEKLIFKEASVEKNQKHAVERMIALREQGFDDELFEKLKQRVLKSEIKYLEQLNKNMLMFKKEQLLYEVSTFEEILNYSVSRLKESEDVKVMSYVDLIETVTIGIRALLKKNNILLIQPQPHEQFNGKEQEILIAEKNENFQKGEIIKVLNSGYKQNGQVIIRANVVAAK